MIRAGADEAGRGPLAGPVVGSAVILTEEQKERLIYSGLRDSKKLSENTRERIFSIINDIGVIWRARSASHERIDNMNILQASLWVMKESIMALPHVINHVIVDGNKAIPGLLIQQYPVVKADALIPEVMAASIVAKVLRDRTMKRLDAIYPEYGFAKHKGYPTKEHRAAIAKYGPSPIHRLSFKLI
ncbi:MAG: ribonuclease HII [Synergistaceae bacterium]|nr:ribonuclease HII [Synergistaceae bacterium]